MSYHWEWIEEVIQKHDAEHPFAPENGEPLKFKPGDKVIYTKEYGVSFEHYITDYYKTEKPCSLYACGARYLLDWDCPWLPVNEANLTLAQ